MMGYSQDWEENVLLFDDVRLIRKLGHGGMGQVWLGEQLSWGQAVAVKQSLSSDPLMLNALEKEADLWLEAGLHPYITTCYYTRRLDKQTVIVLEYAKQGSLQQWIDNGRLYEGEPLYNMMRFGLQAAWGLTCAHRINLLHLDVKPDNILIDEGNAKISDFGLSKAKGINNALSGYTLKYAAPEQLEGMPVGNKTDVYCWAVSMMAMAAKGAFWMSGSSAKEVLTEYAGKHLFFVSLPAPLHDLLTLCFNKDPQKRPSMEQAGDSLQGIMKQLYPEKPVPDKLIERQPLSSAEYNNRAVYRFEKGEKEEAMRYFRKAESMAMEIAVPKYNRMVAEFYNHTLTPGQMMEASLYSVLKPKRYEEKKISAQLMMLNGDLRNLRKNPEIAETSAQVQAWIQKGAPGHLLYAEPKSPIYMNGGDEWKIHDILTKGCLDRNFFHPTHLNINFPLNLICSPKRKTYLFDNDKGAFLLGNVNSGEQSWLACVIRQENYNLETAHFIGEHAVFMEQAPKQICYFKDPRNICFYQFPDSPAIRSLEYPRIVKCESLDDVCAISLLSRNKGYAVLILDISDGFPTEKFALIEEYRGGDLLFMNDGSLRIDGEKIITPNVWNGKKHETDEPLGFIPSNNTNSPESKIFVNFGTEHLIIRHSDQFVKYEGHHKYPYACLWDYSPYRFLPVLFDPSPASGLTFIFEYRGNLLTTRIDRRPDNPPDNPQWLMMKAASGAIASDRQELLSKLGKDYEALLTDNACRNISEITEILRPLVVQEDAQALALWKKIARAFPAGNPFRAIQLEQDKCVYSKPVYSLKYPMPKYPGLPFSLKTCKGRVRYGYDYYNRFYNSHNEAVMYCKRYDGMNFVFKRFKDYPFATVALSSADGMFHLLISPTYGEKPTMYGYLVRILDVRRLEIICENEFPTHVYGNTFAFWKGHTLFLYINGLHVINLDQVDERLAELPEPLIPKQVEMRDPFFFGEQADYFTSRHNTWYICSEILPLPEDPYTDPRFTSIKNKLPFFKKNKRRMLLKEGLGEIWTNQLLK